MRHAIVDVATGTVVNLIDYDSAIDGPPPGMEGGYLAVPSEDARIGWSYRSGRFIGPPTAPEVVPVSVEEAMTAQKQEIESLNKKLATLLAAISEAKGAN